MTSIENMVIINPRKGKEFVDNDIKCSCGKRVEAYVVVNDKLMCKGCLTEYIEMIDNAFVQFMKRAERFD